MIRNPNLDIEGIGAFVQLESSKIFCPYCVKEYYYSTNGFIPLPEEGVKSHGSMTCCMCERKLPTVPPEPKDEKEGYVPVPINEAKNRIVGYAYPEAQVFVCKKCMDEQYSEEDKDKACRMLENERWNGHKCQFCGEYIRTISCAVFLDRRR